MEGNKSSRFYYELWVDGSYARIIMRLAVFYGSGIVRVIQFTDVFISGLYGKQQ